MQSSACCRRTVNKAAVLCLCHGGTRILHHEKEKWFVGRQPDTPFRTIEGESSKWVQFLPSFRVNVCTLTAFRRTRRGIPRRRGCCCYIWMNSMMRCYQRQCSPQALAIDAFIYMSVTNKIREQLRLLEATIVVPVHVMC